MASPAAPPDARESTMLGPKLWRWASKIGTRSRDRTKQYTMHQRHHNLRGRRDDGQGQQGGERDTMVGEDRNLIYDHIHERARGRMAATFSSPHQHVTVYAPYLRRSLVKVRSQSILTPI
ncbi:hypothetical protein Hypma_000933 [Hypsizygus marmoreus]|uniref:Uncharacterized protein n=1 Tax=Hypsizygus marmoreus TaxID=39966 RepID=A0A369JF80_HYPMA|nr:hypothetical protein Hypma_000933 [Hypsizygus marmoreus]